MFTKSSYCASNSCVFVDLDDKQVHVKDNTGSELTVDPAGWADLVAHIKTGALDV